jgi:hypothetical protein
MWRTVAGAMTTLLERVRKFLHELFASLMQRLPGPHRAKLPRADKAPGEPEPKHVGAIAERVPRLADDDLPPPVTGYVTAGYSGYDLGAPLVNCPICGTLSRHCGSSMFPWRCQNNHQWGLGSLNGFPQVIADVCVKPIQVGSEPYGRFLNSASGIQILY